MLEILNVMAKLENDTIDKFKQAIMAIVKFVIMRMPSKFLKRMAAVNRKSNANTLLEMIWFSVYYDVGTVFFFYVLNRLAEWIWI